MRRVTFGIIVVAIGVAMVLDVMKVIDLKWFFDQEWKSYIIPIIIILLGLKLLFSRQHARISQGFSKENAPKTGNGEAAKISALFCGHEYSYSETPFNGANIDVMFGGVKLDLRGAIIENDCTINVHTLFGGVEILLPDGVNLHIDSHCFMGGVGNHSNRTFNPEAKTIRIQADCMLGGIDIKEA